MKYYPICLQITERKCLVVGGGRVAERKARGLMEYDALVTVISPDLTEGLNKLQESGEITWVQKEYGKDDVADFFLVIAATDSPEVQNQINTDAQRHNILLNVADVPEKCNFILPALVKRGALSIAVSTGGNSPAMAKKIRKDLEKQFGVEFEVLNNIMGLIRPEVLKRNLTQPENELIFQKIVDNKDLLAWIKKKNYQFVINHIEKSLAEKIPERLCSAVKKQIEH